MKRYAIAASIRGLITRVLSRPHLSGLLGGALVTAALTGLLAFGPAGAEPVATGGKCQPNRSYAAPTAVALAGKPAGLVLVDDGAATYGVGGSSIAQVRGALSRCAPGFSGADRTGEYLAYTSYAVDWDYSVVPTGATMCRLTDATVGLRLRQLLPRLMSDGSTPRPVTDKWSGFITGLKEHEDGHKALDVAQAQALLDDLQGLQAPCAQIPARADSLTLAHMAAFVAANRDHDADTGYGRDQGAVW